LSRTAVSAAAAASFDHPDATEVFLTHRNLLFTAAYELLGSAADAEDVLQETRLRR
jgi:RNA polymerase sigma-70 factor (ECF subfamily)